MIINATTGTGFGGALAYINKTNVELKPEERPKVIELNQIYGTPEKQAKQMRFVAMENSRSSRPVLHLSVNFSEKEKLTEQKVEQVLKQVIKEFGATPDNNQYAIVKHNDAGHEHYHILLNKVGFDGSNIDTSFVQNKCQVVADKIEQEQELMRTGGRKVLYDATNEKGYRYATKEERATQRKGQKVFKDKNPKAKAGKELIKEKVIDALVTAKSPFELKKFLADQGVEVRFSTNRAENDSITGASFRTSEYAVKGGEIGFKWNEIETILGRNRENSILKMEDVPGVEFIPGKEKQQADPAGIILPVSEPIKIAKEEFEYVQPKVEPNDFGIREPVFENLPIRPIKDDKDIWEDNVLPKAETSLKSAVLHLENELAKGNIDVDFEDILQKEGLSVNPTTKNIEFVALNNRFVLANFNDVVNPRKKITENAIRVYRAEMSRYKQLMAEEPKKISFKEEIFGGDAKIEKERFNEQLQKRKDNAKKPVYRVRDSFKKLSVEVKTDFTKKMAKFERNKLEVQSRNFSKVTAYKINVQNMMEERLGIKKDNNRGLSL